MTNQEKIQYLRRYQAIERRVDRSLEERERWRARAEKITPVHTGMPGGGEVEDGMQQAVEKICEIEAQLDADIDLLIQTKKEIVRAIGTVEEPRYREVLERRYLDGDTWEQIAVDMHYSWRWLHILHKQALNKLFIEVHTPSVLSLN